LPELLGQLALAALAALLLVAVGQPLFTDDAWWHLALGEAYAQQGPWLAEDPLLYTAPGPPAPAAWLADLALFGVWRGAGFEGLRIAHVLTVAAILALAWSLLRRASGSRIAASLGSGAFAVLGAYRLVQLRPHLLTILATLVLYRLLLEEAAPPSRRRLALAVGLLALWANAHGGFLLGPILLAAAVGGLLLAAPLRPSERRARDRARAKRLAVALGLGLLATLANPDGVAQHLAYFSAGVDSPALARVADEWARFDPFRLPLPNLPPSPLAWGLVWGLLAAAPVTAFGAARRWRRGDDRNAESDPDPALVALAATSLAALLLAVRFLWLGIFPLLLLARGSRARFAVRGAPGRAAAWTAAAAALLLVLGFLQLGAWPMISRGIRGSWSGYAQPYAAGKYQAHAVWMLDDAGLEGNLFNEYFTGGFLGFWLAPELRAFVNGTLNVSEQAMNANRAIRERRGSEPGEDFAALLDRQRVDLFLGIRLPQIRNPHRPWYYTTGHLERAPGWIPVFRNLTSSVHLRTHERNRANLVRVADYYARHEVPFDPGRGFDPERVIREAPDWAVEHGLVPVNFQGLAAASHTLDLARRRQALERLASLYAALGLYEQAIRLDRRVLRSDPAAVAARRRLVWSLLRLERGAEALEEAQGLAGAAPTDGLSHAIADAARRYATLADEAEARALVALLPVFTRPQAAQLMAGVVPPQPRTSRRSAAGAQDGVR
jgi:hypothetical protein